MRKFLSIVLVAATLFTMVSAGIMTSTASTDPADSYTPITAPYEDSSLQMWFQHANVKVHQEDTTSTGRNTYSIYMAKNEIQGAQVVLYSPTETKSNITARVTDFTAMDGSGNTVEADLYYEFYIQVEGVNSTDVLGVNKAEDSIIRDGLIPDAIADIERVNYKVGDPGRFTLVPGKTQTLITRLKTTSDTAPGWYSGTVNVYNSNNQVIKTATVYAYVWNFEIPEESHFDTAFHISMTGANEANYKQWYDYLLENRLLGMSVPGELNSKNEYLSNPRVSAFRVSSKNTSILTDLTTAQIASIYNDLSTMDNWEEVKEKAYFYTVDEPTSQEQSDALHALNGSNRPTVTTVNQRYDYVASSWENPYALVAFHENHPYPYYSYSVDLAYKNGKYLTATDGSSTFNGVKDAIQGIMDNDSVTLWCPKMNAYTPAEYLTNYVATNESVTKVRNLNGIVSGFNITNVAGCFFNWDSIFGSFPERIKAYQTEKAAEGKNIKVWWYASGVNAHYTYANHLIENTGLQTQLMFWQAMQEGVTGYLNYGANLWSTTEEGGGPVYGTGSYDGSLVKSWRVNQGVRNGHYMYGNGVIFYGTDMRGTLRINQNYLGTIRVELMRDGIEDYEMLRLYRQYYGEEKMQDMISKVSSNVVCYLSLPGFNRSGWNKNLTDEDIFALIRIEVGNAVEAAVGGIVPADKYTVTLDGKVYGSYDAGATVTLPTPEVVEVAGVVSRFYKWEGAEAYGSSVTTTTAANSKVYTMAMPAANVELTSKYVTIGDLNSDGKLNARDYVVFKAASVSAVELTAEQTEAMDIDGNGVVNAKDAEYIKMYLGADYIPAK